MLSALSVSVTFVLPGDQGGENAHQDRQYDAGEIVQVEFRRAPLPLQRGADHIIEIQKQQQPDGVPQGVVAGHEDKRHQPPELTGLDGLPVEGQEANGAVPGKYRQHVDDGVPQHDEFHQIGDTEAGMVVGEPVHRGVELSQSKPSSMFGMK